MFDPDFGRRWGANAKDLQEMVQGLVEAYGPTVRVCKHYGHYCKVCKGIMEPHSRCEATESPHWCCTTKNCVIGERCND